jgi:thioredoxin-like negative regulator of GroEL
MKTDKATEWNTAEAELRLIIGEAQGPVVVLISEPYHPGARIMAERLRRLSAEAQRFRLVEVSLAAHRTWAASHDVFGTPAVLHFQRGDLCAIILGVVEEEELARRLATA